jgi:hypothetical protein
MTRAALLPWPAPYRAALALSNDTDDLWDPNGWWSFLRFLNTRESTPLGEGLGLEVGDAFWMYSDHPVEQPGAYFDGLSDRPSAFAPYLRVLGRAGYLDTLHTWGNFSRHGGFTRAHAERGIRALTEDGIRPRVWVNHGGAHDFQNLWVGCGDLPENPEARGAPCPEYHWDLTRGFGVRYLWLGDLTRVPGQERGIGAEDWLHPASPFRREAAGYVARGLARRLAYRDLLARAPNHAPHRNRLLGPKPLRDGTVATRFVRYGDFDRATFADLAWLLRPYALDRLERTGGASVLFVHWCRHPGRDFTALDPGAVAALVALGRRAREARIWVTTTGRLLAYVEARRSLRWTERSTPEGFALDLDAAPLADGRIVETQDLAGVAFRVPHPQRTRLRWRGEPLETEHPEPGVIAVPRKPLWFPDPPPEAR